MRENELRAQHERFSELQGRVESEIGGRLGDFAELVATEITSWDKLFAPEAIKQEEKRLGAYLGSFLKGEIREDWLRRAKSRVVGTKYALQRIRGRIAQKDHFVDMTKGLRAVFKTQRDQIWQGRLSVAEKSRALAVLRAEALATVRANLATINRINDEIRSGLNNAAAHLYMMKADYANRQKEIVDPDTIRRSAPVFPALEAELVEALDAEGSVLGKILRADAQAMELRFREINLRTV
jgi:hypothetical protein